jgi:aspartyl-tRNA(Asn)/glutamyl-tRNA(Gln) amidotransferase subunit A
MSEELCFLTVAEASRLIKARKLSPVELTDAYLKRVETLEPQLNAFIINRTRFLWTFHRLMVG